MRKVIANMLISLDGVVEEPGSWHFPYFSDEMGAAVDAVLAAARPTGSGTPSKGDKP
jgi:hypothetical protein